MKKAIILIPVLLLTACGSDGTVTKTTTTTSGPGVSPTTTVQTTETRED